MTGAKKTTGKPKSKQSDEIILIYERPTLISTFKWGNGKYCVNEEITLEKFPKLIKEKERCYD